MKFFMILTTEMVASVRYSSVLLIKCERVVRLFPEEE